MSDTRYTKTGQPRMGAAFRVIHEDGRCDTLTVVAKGWGQCANLVEVCIEWADGHREWWPWADLKDVIAYAEAHEEKR